MLKPLSLPKTSTGLLGALAIAGGTAAYGSIVQVTPPGSYSIPQGTNTGPAGSANPYNPAYAGDRAWDVNLDGSNDFFFRLRYLGPADGTTSSIEWQDTMNPFSAALQATNGLLTYAGPFSGRYSFAFPAGQSIGSAGIAGGAFSTSAAALLGSRYYYLGSGASFYGGFATGPGTNRVAPGMTAFAGFRFTAADGTHYGWVQLSVNAGSINFVNAAYESTPGMAITTGAIPEPGTLALLAVGAAGVIGAGIKRRRRSSE